MNIIIVGAGILGLTAALRLSKAGCKVTLLEKDREAGGLCRGFDAGSMRADRYHHFITGSDQRLLSLIRELGLTSHLQFKIAKTASYTDRRIVPLSGAFDLLKFPGVPIFEKLRFGFAVNALTRFSKWNTFETIPAAKWIQEKGGQKLYEKMWKDLFEGKFEDKVNEIPLSWFWARVRRRISHRKGSADLFSVLNGSFDVLTKAMVDQIKKKNGRLLFDAEVERIEKTDNTFTVTAKGKTFHADRVLATVPNPVFEKLVNTPSEPIEYSGIVNAVFALKKPVSDFFWINVNKPRLPFLGIIQTTRLQKDPDHHLVYLPSYRPADHKDFDKPEEEILERFQKGLFTVFPLLTENDIASRHLFRERLADPYYTLNYSEKIAPHKTNLPGLYCFNTAQIYPQTRSADSSIAFGEKAATMILADRLGHE